METIQSKPLNPADSSWWRIILRWLGVVLLVYGLWWGWSLLPLRNPYIKEVLSIVGDVGQGRDIFLQNCASCHGVQGAGHVGPSLHGVGKRRSPLGIISQVTGGQTPPMPQFQPSPQAMADLLRYLEQLPPS
ncbi:cytochrome c class I [Gloeomargarita lithophora Alchichica-D10]|uniref:Cytochrome c class I n=1 Tax=Gloeomargarita lithophora Alchichica-D10 TaxID=1188229 RepID=A0A1J0ACW0_9CYAN|nr:cytochrome c [Gloeomargarita lithophora]APB33772.1 cytochrome c class I [Gloeomargarita lithophora Alchichica-D10]